MKCSDCKNELATCGCRCYACSGTLIDALKTNVGRYPAKEQPQQMRIGNHQFSTTPATEELWYAGAYDCPNRY